MHSHLKPTRLFYRPLCHHIALGAAVLPKNTLAFVSSVPVGNDAGQFVGEGGIVTGLEDIFVAASENGFVDLHRSTFLALHSAFGVIRSYQRASGQTCSMPLDPHPDGIRSKQCRPSELGNPRLPSTGTTIDRHPHRMRWCTVYESKSLKYVLLTTHLRTQLPT